MDLIITTYDNKTKLSDLSIQIYNNETGFYKALKINEFDSANPGIIIGDFNGDTLYRHK